MSAGGHEPQRGKREASHGASVAQKLLCWVALASACDESTALPPVDPDDIDGDGIGNELDLCPGVSDPAQHDEDGDRFGDACDVCPTVPDPLQTDTGEADTKIMFADGIGDACDPRPGRGGDRIGALHTFATDTTSQWLGAGWSIDGDRARASGAARWQHKLAVIGDGLTARLVLPSLEWSMPGGFVSVVLDGEGVEGGRSCTLLADRDADGKDELELRELGGAVEILDLPGAVTGPVELHVARAVERRVGKGTVECRIILSADQRITISIPTDDSILGLYAFAADHAEVSATSLIVYKTPLACPSGATSGATGAATPATTPATTACPLP